jgi:putative membrane protein
VTPSSEGRPADHLANERTFLAWLRTAITLLGLGFVVAKFGLWLRELSILEAHGTKVAGSGTSLPIGIGILSLGAATAILGAVRYQSARRAIERGEIAAGHWVVMIVAGLVVVLALVLMAYLVESSLRA